MSITVKLWDDKELNKLQSDKWLATVFMNKSTFSGIEMKYYPYNLRKHYRAFISCQDEPIKFYATDDKNALKFIRAEYNGTIELLEELITTTRYVTITD